MTIRRLIGVFRGVPVWLFFCRSRCTLSFSFRIMASGLGAVGSLGALRRGTFGVGCGAAWFGAMNLPFLRGRRGIHPNWRRALGERADEKRKSPENSREVLFCHDRPPWLPSTLPRTRDRNGGCTELVRTVTAQLPFFPRRSNLSVLDHICWLSSPDDGG